MKIKLITNIPDYKKLKKEMGLDPEGRVQKYVDSFVLYQSEPYEPGRHIHDSGVVATDIGSGLVVWDSPDSVYLYEGKLMVDPITKRGAFPIRAGKISFNSKDGEIEGFVSRRGVQKIMDPKGRDLKFKRGGKRGSHWYDRMMNDKGEELIRGIEETIINGVNND